MFKYMCMYVESEEVKSDFANALSDPYMRTVIKLYTTLRPDALTKSQRSGDTE